MKSEWRTLKAMKAPEANMCLLLRVITSSGLEEPVLSEESIALFTEGKSVTSVIKWFNDRHLKGYIHMHTYNI